MNKISVLVAVPNYPSKTKHLSIAYVHTRDIFYANNGIDVTVLNFRAKENYEVDGIKVVSKKGFGKLNPKDYDLLICHAPNLKHHFRFLIKHGKEFQKFLFFFHGHEVLVRNKVYPRDYSYLKSSITRTLFGNVYDSFKLAIWRRYYPKVADKSWFVFVSKWMLDEFVKWTKIPYDIIKDKSSITYNCIGKPFEDAVYNPSQKKEFDFITIRHNLDNAKYGIDLVNKWANNNPNNTFLIIGKGLFFDHYTKAKNITWLNTTLDHKDIVDYLQKARCALMPTRTDSQGLMMCEMASIGMPLITSDIPVCYESLGEFRNVRMISNNDEKVNLQILLDDIEKGLPYPKNTKYYNCNTSGKEVDLIRLLCTNGEKA